MCQLFTLCVFGEETVTKSINLPARSADGRIFYLQAGGRAIALRHVRTPSTSGKVTTLNAASPLTVPLRAS